MVGRPVGWLRGGQCGRSSPSVMKNPFGGFGQGHHMLGGGRGLVYLAVHTNSFPMLACCGVGGSSVTPARVVAF
jgi:hypothetical protein